MSNIVLKEFNINERVDNDNFKVVASVVIDDTKGYYVSGQYNAVFNTFHPTILGDPYELEEHYDQIQRTVEERIWG